MFAQTLVYAEDPSSDQSVYFHAGSVGLFVDLIMCMYCIQKSLALLLDWDF